ncbi:hypothetical protein B0T17DRAFT_591771 [Bombardia bombarda]|uniref:Uncharacterized protein n=1 Tax=Bombardia bombarda TaxID=252184 RepID=A0AA39WM45_9PEZI|nr:hypothetical protein B0T17DRAFT_591771 [Bombardia bombarda]
MSRNVRQKYPPATVKTTRRRGSDTSSSLNLDSDDGYSGLEDLSDSDEDDEEHVYAAEEKHIISRVSRKRPTETPRPPEIVEEDDDADEEDEEDEEEDEEDEDEDEAEEDDAADETTSWDGILSECEDVEDVVEQSSAYLLDQDVSVERHVRFAGVPDSDSDSTTSETSEDLQGFFPDIFVDQNALDPAFRREIENDDDSSNSGSFWDFNSGSQDRYTADSDDEPFANELDDVTPTATPFTSQPPTEASTPIASSEVQELDGYETDGDTTEEDVPEPVVRRKQVRRVQSADMSSDSDTERPIRFRRGQPRVGRFNLDSTDQKPIAVVNPISRKMMIFTPQKASKLDLSPESFNIDFTAPDLAACSPMLSNPGYVMMGAMFSQNTFGDFLNTQPFGPAEAFFPCPSDAITGEDSDYSEADVQQEDEEESMLKLEDFITFHQDSSDEEEEPAADWNGDVESSPTRPKTAASGTSAASDVPMAVHPLLSHFDNNTNAVGAFRRNQINQQLIFSDKTSQDSLAFANPYYHGTLRGIKTGSMETVTTPITPARRQKRGNSTAGNAANGASNGSGILNRNTELPASPVSQKRKATSNLTDNIHKRHRSISEMEVLHI